MRKLLTVATALLTACMSAGVAAADDSTDGSSPYSGDTATTLQGTPPRGYGLGGAHVPGIPYDEYIRMTGAQWFPDLERQKIDYSAGQVQGYTFERLFPGIDRSFPGVGLNGPSIGESVAEGAGNVIETVNRDGPGTVLGLSEGAMVVNAVQARLAADPNAPPPDQLSFAVFGDPIGQHAFGDGWLRQNFPVGSTVPSLDFVIPPPVESQYDTYSFVSAYDSIADWPDRTDNWMAVANAIFGLATGHTAVAFTKPANVPTRNIRTTVNSRGGKTTTFMIPEQHLPLVMPFKYLGVDDDTLNRLDAILKPMVDSGYSRNDDPATAPITVDPVYGYDPAEVTAPATNATYGDQVGTDPISQMLALLGSFGTGNGSAAPDAPAAPAPAPLAAEAAG
ncbi:MAG: PE-PPE domain-containing protein [Mycobacterium sp.]|nr:PE-PPE domain-containing protein [Mycobacterium sp.]